VQQYGGEFFCNLRDEADDTFLSLPAPTPTVRRIAPAEPTRSCWLFGGQDSACVASSSSNCFSFGRSSNNGRRSAEPTSASSSGPKHCKSTQLHSSTSNRQARGPTSSKWDAIRHGCDYADALTARHQECKTAAVCGTSAHAGLTASRCHGSTA